MKKYFKQFTAETSGDNYYTQRSVNGKQVLILNNIFRKLDSSDISKAYIDIYNDDVINALTLYWDKTGTLTNFNNLDNEENVVKLDYIPSCGSHAQIDVTSVLQDMQRQGKFIDNQRFIVIGSSFIPEEGPDCSITIYYDHKRGVRERKATLPFEFQNVQGFIDLSDQSVHMEIVDSVGSGRMPISVKHYYNSTLLRDYDTIMFDNGVNSKTVYYLCACGFKLNYQQFLIVDDGVNSSTNRMSDGVSNAFYTWINAKGEYVHFAKNATNGKISCEQLFTLSQNGSTYEITDISNNKLIFAATTDSKIFKLVSAKDKFNNTITINYIGNWKIDNIVSSSGDRVEFTYDEDTDVMTGMVEVLDENTRVTTSFITNGDPLLEQISTTGSHQDINFKYYHRYDEEKAMDLYILYAVYGANGVGYFWKYNGEDVNLLELYSIGTSNGISNGDISFKTLGTTVDSFKASCDSLLLYTAKFSNRKTLLTEKRNEESKTYLFDNFGSCVKMYENKYDGSGDGTPQARSFVNTNKNINVSMSSVSNAEDLMKFATKPTATVDMTNAFTDEEKSDAVEFISASISKNSASNTVADINVYSAVSSSNQKTISFSIPSHRFVKFDDNDNDIAPNDYILSAWALADSFAITDYAKGLKVNAKSEVVKYDISDEYESLYNSYFYGNNRKFELCAEIKYNMYVEDGDDYTETDVFSATFDWTNKKLQQLCVPIRIRHNKKEDIASVIVYVNYANNNGTVKVCGVSLKSGSWSFEQFNKDLHLIYERSSEKERYYTEYTIDSTLKLPTSCSIKEEFGLESGYTENYTYNQNKSLSTITDSKNYVTEYTYSSDNKGDLIKTKKYRTVNGQNTYAFIEESEFNSNGEIIKTYNEMGNLAQTFSYAKGVLQSVLPVNGSAINYGYDSAYKLVKSISATENGVLNKNNTEYLKGVEIEHSDKTSEGDSQASIFTYEYDSFGRIIKILMDGALYCEIEYDNVNHNKKTITYSCGEVEKMETDKNDTEVTVNRTDATTGQSKEQIEMKLDSYGRMKHLRDNSDGERKYIFEYDDCGRVKKVGVEDKENDDCFYTIYNKRTFNNNNQITEVSFEHDTDDLVGEEKYLDRISFEYEKDYEGKLLSAEHKQETNLGKETQTFDELERVFATNKLGGALGKIYSYHENGDDGKNITCDLVACEEYFSNNVFEEGFIYQYDALNRLTEVRKSNIIIKKYTYDGLGRLSREDNADLQKTYTFVYDNSGNILTKKEYQYTTGSLENLTPINTYSYTYNKNMLVSVVKNNDVSNTLTCTYPTVGDSSKTQIGNPLTYCGKTLSWSKVHQLASFNGLTFGYNYAGIRTRKGNVKFAYEQDKLIVQQNADGSKIVFYYGLDGLTGFNYNNQTYVYKKNVFGDIIGIYRVTTTNEDDEISYSSTLVAKYVYDAWGNHKVLNANDIEDNSLTFIGNINPFRYRSYYFDVETSFYYLQSRYYDPQVRRFISMDKVEYIDSELINGVNLFVYCGNDPINNSDPKGEWFIPPFVVKMAIGAVVNIGFTLIQDIMDDGKINTDCKKYIGSAVSGAIGSLSFGKGAVKYFTSFAVGFIGDVGEQFIAEGNVNFMQSLKSGAMNFASEIIGDSLGEQINKYIGQKKATKILNISNSKNRSLKIQSIKAKINPSFSKGNLRNEFKAYSLNQLSDDIVKTCGVLKHEYINTFISSITGNLV